MYSILQHAHSGLRWIVLLVLIIAIIQNYRGWKAGQEWTDRHQRINLITLIALHVQLLLGLVLYFISPAVSFGEGWMSNSINRFYTLEHSLLMLVAVAIGTLAYARMKRIPASQTKFRTGFYLLLAALLIILAAIPWPFRDLGGAWI